MTLPGGNVTTKIQWKRYEQVARLMIQSVIHISNYQKGNDKPAKLMVTMGAPKSSAKIGMYNGKSRNQFFTRADFPQPKCSGMMEALRFIAHLVGKHSNPLGTTSGDYSTKKGNKSVFGINRTSGYFFVGKVTHSEITFHMK